MLFRILVSSIIATTMLITPVRAQSTSVVSPVIQIISYTDLYGNAVEMMGRGSASIIDSQGTILTNNHVVDDGQGNVASAFSICVTRALDQKPDCSYTASLIDRDPDRDIAILRIDPLDVQGRAVSYSTLPVIQIDYNYRPQAQDTSLAIGYPWVGVDTLTQTQGTVAGSIEYNDYTYIKTDTLIAGGNSGGPLMVGGKMVGVNTFTVGGWMDASLGYALLIRDAQDFITSALTKPVQSSVLDINFAAYKATLDRINNEKKLTDTVFSFTFDGMYQIRNYQPNQSFQLVPRDNKRIQLLDFSARLIPTPPLKTSEDLAYYLGQIGFFNKDYQKLTKTTIDGRIRYTPVFKNDLSEGEAERQQIAITKINNNALVVVSADGAFGDSQIGKQLIEERKRVRGQLRIIAPATTKSSSSMRLRLPAVSVSNMTGLLASDTAGTAKLYLRNTLYSYIDWSVVPISRYSGKGKTVDELYDIITQDIAPEFKQRFVFQGKEGFMTCDINSYGYGMTDPAGRPLQLTSCTMYIFLSAREETDSVLVTTVVSESHLLESDLDYAIGLLSRSMTVGSGKTTLSNILKQRVGLLYRDIDDQADGRHEMLKVLVRYNLLQNDESLDPETPMTRQTYARLYFKYLYNKELTDPAVQKALKGLKISRGAYVDSNKIGRFDDILRLRMAGIRLRNETSKGIQQWRTIYNNKSNTTLRQQLETYEAKLYGSRKISMYEAMRGMERGYYQPYVTVRYSTLEGLTTTSYVSDDALSFDGTAGQSPTQIQELKSCATSTARLLNTRCLKIIQQYATSQLSYQVVTKGEAIDRLVDRMDIGLFDPERAAKKSVNVEDSE